MSTPVSILLLITSSRVLRADFGSTGVWRDAPRRPGSSLGDALKEALALGGRPGAGTWVLCDEVFTQKVVLNPVQVAGLTPEQLTRALSFEVEPFSGITVDEAALGFRDRGGGTFDVAEMPRMDRDAVLRITGEAGIKVAGIAHTAALPQEEAALRCHLDDLRARLEAGSSPVIEPPARPPSPYRFVALGATAAALALGLVLALLVWNTVQKAILTRANDEFARASGELAIVNQQNEALRKQLATLQDQEGQRKRLTERRNSLAALVRSLAATRPDDVVVRGMKAEGASTLVVTGIGLEAEAVDELSVVLTHALRSAGWNAQLRQKTGLRRLANGGPWEFALALTHDEALMHNASASSSSE